MTVKLLNSNKNTHLCQVFCS